MSSSPIFSIPPIGLPTSSDTPTPTPTPASSAQQTSTPSQPPSTTSDQASSTGDPNLSSSSSSQPQSSSSTASSTSSTESSSSSSSLPTSSSTTLTTFSSSSSSPVFSTSLEQSTRSDGGVVTVTHTFSFSQEGPTETGNAAAANGNSTSKGFFHNKGAVAGVFTIVGLVVAVIAIALITNAVRRRRAKKFDRDVAEAAAEAAAAAHNVGPDFDDDEYGYTNRSVYTDHTHGTHGTYNQAPMKHAESYTMSELPPFDPYSTGAAAAGNAGVGAAGLNRSRSTTTPYNAFAGPPGAPPPMPTQPDPYFDPNPPAVPMHGAYPGVYNDPQSSLLHAAGLGAPVGAGVAAAATAVALSHSSTLSRNKSSGARTLGGMSGSDHQDPYADDPYAMPYSQPSQQYPYPPQPQPQRGYSPPQQVQYSPPLQSQYLPSQQGHSAHSHSPTPQDANRLSVVSGNDPYAGYASASPTQAKFPNPHSPGSPPQESDSDSDEPTGHSSEHRSEHDEYDRDAFESRASLRDEEDYGYGGGRRVLKVANE